MTHPRPSYLTDCHPRSRQFPLDWKVAYYRLHGGAGAGYVCPMCKRSVYVGLMALSICTPTTKFPGVKMGKPPGRIFNSCASPATCRSRMGCFVLGYKRKEASHDLGRTKADDDMPARNEEMVVTYGLRRCGDSWVIATWSQGCPGSGPLRNSRAGSRGETSGPLTSRGSWRRGRKQQKRRKRKSSSSPTSSTGGRGFNRRRDRAAQDRSRAMPWPSRASTRRFRIPRRQGRVRGRLLALGTAALTPGRQRGVPGLQRRQGRIPVRLPLAGRVEVEERSFCVYERKKLRAVRRN